MVIKKLIQLFSLLLFLVISAQTHSLSWSASTHINKGTDYEDDSDVDILLSVSSIVSNADIPYSIQVPYSITTRNVVLTRESEGSYVLVYPLADNDEGTLIDPGTGFPYLPSHNEYFDDFNSDGLQDLLLQAKVLADSSVIVFGFKADTQPQIQHVDGISADLVTLSTEVDGIVVDRSGNNFLLTLNLATNEIVEIQWPCAIADDSDCDGVSDYLDAFPVDPTRSIDTDADGITDSEDADIDNDGIVNGSDSAPQDRNNGNTVGAIQGEFAVNASGKSVYNIPLRLILGIGSMTPALSLNYSQDNGNGLLGMGWTLGGLSEISRCPTTIVQDGFINGVNFNSQDKFCLNGFRLILVSGSYGENGAEYRTENETFAKIISHGQTGTGIAAGPTYFEVRRRDGVIENYGNSVNSRWVPNSLDSVLTWAVNSQEDRDGNQITYSYINNSVNGNFYVSAINYGGNPSVPFSTTSSIAFEYEARLDIPPSYANTSFTSLPVRLNKVKNLHGAELVRTYDLNYIVGLNGRSVLNTLSECTGPTGVDSCLEPHTFMPESLAADESDFSTFVSEQDSSFSAASLLWQNYLVGDVNADGRSDLVWVYRDGADIGRVIYQSQSSSLGFTKVDFDLDNGYNANLIASKSDQKYLFGDVNGDGRSDLIWAVKYDDSFFRSVFLANATGDGFTSLGYEHDSGSSVSAFIQRDVVSGDFNGDKRTDIAWIYSHNNELEIRTYLAMGSGDAVALSKVSELNIDDYAVDALNNQHFLTGDVNGDGKADIVWVFTYQNDIYRALFLANAAGTGFTHISLGKDTNEFDNTFGPLFFSLGDTNADGKADLIWVYENGSNQLGRKVYRASQLGTSFIAEVSDTDVGVDTNGHTFQSVSVVDINGDDRADFVYTYKDIGTVGGVSYIADATGFSFTRHDSFSRATDPGSSNHNYLFADVTADGKADTIWTSNEGNTLHRKTFAQTQSYPDHLRTIDNGLGQQIDIRYAYLANNADYTVGSPVTYPLRNDIGLSYVVDEVDFSNGIGGNNTFSYAYTGAVTDLHGRGFLGFNQKVETDVARGLKKTENYLQIFPFIGELSSSKVEVISNSRTIEENYNHWKVTPITHTSGQQSHFRYLKDKAVIKYNINDGLEEFASVMVDVYDLTYGYKNTEAVVTGRGFTGGGASFNPSGSFSVSNITAPQKTLTKSFDYLNTPSSWRIGFLERETETHNIHSAESGTENRTLINEYTQLNANSFLTQTEKLFVGSDIEQTKTHTHDAFGNITATTLTGKDIDGGNVNPQNNSTNQFIKGIYPDVQSNHFGHTNQFVYDHRFGSLLSSEDPNNLFTNYTFNGFGQQLRQTNSNGTVTRWLYDFCADISGCPTHAEYAVTTLVSHPLESVAGAPKEINYFDSHNRVLRTTHDNADGTSIFIDKSYDALGRLASLSHPYLQGDAPEEISYDYDQLDRITLESRADGGSTANAYLSNPIGNRTQITSTVIVPGSSNKTLLNNVYKNTLNQLVRSDDANNTQTEFKYDALGSLRFTRVDGNAATDTVIASNNAGHRISLVDPNAGTIQQKVNSLGQVRVKTHVGSPSHTITSIFDEIGRLTQRTDNDGSTDFTSAWTYDNKANGIGLLGTVSGSNYLKSLTYDGLSRLASSSVQLFSEASPKLFSYDYDGYSRQANMTYPSGVSVDTSYNANGYRQSFRNAQSGLVYSNAQTYDAFGNITTEQFGNGVTTSRTYDPKSGRIETLRTGLVTVDDIQKLDFVHDTAGNLVSRQTRRANSEDLTEAFFYDDLHRVTMADTSGLVSGSRNIGYDYDDLGNIKTKSDASDTNGYSYGGNGGGPNAVSQVNFGGSSTAYNYGFKGNMTQRGSTALSYSVFNKPTAITDAAASINTTLDYGSNRQRIRQRSNNNGRLVETHYYDGAYEVAQIGNSIREKTYIGDFAVHTSVRSAVSPSQADDVSYLHRDHLGSVGAVTNEQGVLDTRMAFDPFGARRDGDWEDFSQTIAELTNTTFSTTTRGFTNHEHLDDVGLIHMGGRVYDPAIGRFLSPDDFVQFPENSQSYNRYSYVLNNPLSYTDPSGEVIPLVIGAAAIYKAYNVYDTVSTGAADIKTALDSTASTQERAVAGLSLTASAVGIPKFAQRFGGKIVDKVKSLGKRGKAKSVGGKKGPEGQGTDKNTEKRAENGRQTTLELRDNGVDSKEFQRKLNRLKQAQKDGRLTSEAAGVSYRERSSATRKHRREIQKRIDRRFADQPESRKAATERLKNSDIDHIIEDRLGGKTERSNFKTLNPRVNKSVGSQIGKQVNDGDIIVGVKEKF